MALNYSDFVVVAEDEWKMECRKLLNLFAF
jgi:hypothetical protein